MQLTSSYTHTSLQSMLLILCTKCFLCLTFLWNIYFEGSFSFDNFIAFQFIPICKNILGFFEDCFFIFMISWIFAIQILRTEFYFFSMRRIRKPSGNKTFIVIMISMNKLTQLIIWNTLRWTRHLFDSFALFSSPERYYIKLNIAMFPLARTTKISLYL